MDKRRFGLHLAQFRKQYALTQMELAEKVDCALSTISRIENGMEYPKLNLFEKFNKVFERFGVTYEELAMEEVFEFQRAKEELLIVIEKGRAEEIERKLDRFKELMDENNIEHKQYYILGYLVYMRKKGMSIEEFLDRIVAVFELGRKLPKLNDMTDIKLTKIEHMLIYRIGMAHLEVGNDTKAIDYIKGLFLNGFRGNTKFLKQRSEMVSAGFAKILIKRGEYKEAEKCINYVLEKITESMDTRILFQSLILQEELFRNRHDNRGAEIISKFIFAAEQLVNYMHKCKRLK